MRKICKHRKPFLLLLAPVLIMIALVVKTTGASLHTKEPPLVIAYGDDMGGVVLQSALKCMTADYKRTQLDAINMGDCCGSTAQFALSTGQVDVAILCPDAVRDLEDNGKKYSGVGDLVTDGNVLVRRPDSPETLAKSGYMNGRKEQEQLLIAVFGDSCETVPMFASALPYALENRAVDAVMMDAALAIKLGYPMETISSGEVTSVMIVQNHLLEDPRVEELKKAINETVQSFSDEEKACELLCSYLDTDNTEEVIALWKTVTVQFGSL